MDRILSFRVVKAVLRVVHFCLNLKTSISMHNLLVSITVVTFSILHGCKEQELELENTTGRETNMRGCCRMMNRIERQQG